MLEVGIESEFHVFSLGHDPSFLVFSYSLFEEIRFALQRNELHEVEWIFGKVNLK